MKGLLIKDLYELVRQCKFVLILCFVYIVMSMAGENAAFFATFSIIFSSMLPITIIALDERNKWDSYAVTMPYTRKEMVLCKYLLSLLAIFIMSLLYIVMRLLVLLITKGDFTLFSDSVMILFPVILMAVFVNSINLPVVFKFGAEKGRLAIMLTYAGIGGVIGAASALRDDSINFLLNIVSNVPPFMFLIISAVLMIISYFISAKFYEQKEL